MLAPLLQVVAWNIALGALMFWSAGTLAYPGGWAFILIMTLGGAWVYYWLYKHDPHLLKERMSSPVQRTQKPWDRVFLSAFMIAFLVWFALMAWDAGRHGGSAVPMWLQIVGAVGFVLGLFSVWLTFRENSYAAPVVKIQQGQRVIDTGPYARVRHPMYAGGLLYLASMPLLMGSWWGFLAVPFFVLGIAWRAMGEEHMLRNELAGYADYAERVRYRLIPGLW